MLLWRDSHVQDFLKLFLNILEERERERVRDNYYLTGFGFFSRSVCFLVKDHACLICWESSINYCISVPKIFFVQQYTYAIVMEALIMQVKTSEYITVHLFEKNSSI